MHCYLTYGVAAPHKLSCVALGVALGAQTNMRGAGCLGVTLGAQNPTFDPDIQRYAC
jgi:hypothetical protein